MTDDIVATLTQLRAAGNKLTMLVFGTGSRADAIAAEAERASQNYAALAQVVRVQDHAALEADFSEVADAAARGYEVVVLTLSFRIAARLRDAEALDFVALDGAFVCATRS